MRFHSRIVPGSSAKLQHPRAHACAAKTSIFLCLEVGVATPRSMNQESSGSERAISASLHLLENGYILSSCALDWGMGTAHCVRGQGVDEFRAELAAQGLLETEARDQPRLAGQVGVKARDLDPEREVGPAQGSSFSGAGVLDCAAVPPGDSPAPVLTGLTTCSGLFRVQRVDPATPASWRSLVRAPGWRVRSAPRVLTWGLRAGGLRRGPGPVTKRNR